LNHTEEQTIYCAFNLKEDKRRGAAWCPLPCFDNERNDAMRTAPYAMTQCVRRWRAAAALLWGEERRASLLA